MTTGPLQKATEDAVYGLTSLATAYGLLFEFRVPGNKGADRISAGAPGPRPPMCLHTIDVILLVAYTGWWADAMISEWLAEPFTNFRLWNQGDPNPLVPMAYASAAERLPKAAEYAGDAMFDMAESIDYTIRQVRKVMGREDPSQLLDTECPACHCRTVVRLPHRTACAACNYEKRGR